MSVLQLLSLNHYSPLPSNSLHSAHTGMKWAQDLTDLSRVPQGSTTLSLTWTMTRNGPGLEALSQTGSALMELTTMVSTMLWIGTQSHRACFSELGNSILIIAPSWWCSIFRAISAWFDARGWFHSLCKRVMEQDWSWNRPALDYIELYRSASKLWEPNHMAIVWSQQRRWRPGEAKHEKEWRWMEVKAMEECRWHVRGTRWRLKRGEVESS